MAKAEVGRAIRCRVHERELGSAFIIQHTASTGAMQECCVCLQSGASFVAQCGCAYHASCLEDYAKADGLPRMDLRCHLHGRHLGASFVGRNMAGFTLDSRRLRAAAVETVPYQTLKIDDPSTVVNQPDVCELRRLPEAWESLRRPAPSASLRRPGTLGRSFGVPCSICFGEDGMLKTLHCGFKVHDTCLRDFWRRSVMGCCRITDISCPADVGGCTEYLTEADIKGVIGEEDLAWAQDQVRSLDEKNMRLMRDLRTRSTRAQPMFPCGICLTDHEIEGCCTLPCQHRFCFESLQYHFDIVVRERRLDKLVCPADGCGFNLRSEEHIYIFQACLPDCTYQKLLEFLTRDDPRVFDCRATGCEERVFVDTGDAFNDLCCPKGHRFCGQCDNGPHPDMSCESRREQLENARKENEANIDQEKAWCEALEMGWKPCPRRCEFGGGFKAGNECDHVTCQCGFQFCWDCGVCRQVPLMHDNRWHKPACRYHTKPADVSEAPKRNPKCPECMRLPPGRVCQYPADDGYPHSFMRSGARRVGVTQEAACHFAGAGGAKGKTQHKSSRRDPGAKCPPRSAAGVSKAADQTVAEADARAEAGPSSWYRFFFL